MRVRSLFLASLLLTAIGAIAGCGGGGTTPSASATPTSAPVPASTSAPVGSSSSQVTVSAGGNSTTVTVPAATSGSGTITFTASASLPSGDVALSRVRMQSSTCSPSPLAFLTMTPSANITLPQVPEIAITLASASSSSNAYYIAFLAPGASQWQLMAMGPASISGNTVTFAAVNQSVVLTAGDSYGFALYSIPSSCVPSPSPSPSPLSSPTASPAPLWSLGGSDASISLTQGTTPGSATLAAYHGVGVKVQFSAPLSGSGTLKLSDALNGAGGVNDVTPIAPNTAPLPVDNATSGYTPVIYLSVLNQGANTIDFGPNIPGLTITDSGLTGYHTCELDVYGNDGNASGASWFSVAQAGSTGTPSGSGVIIAPGSLPAGSGSVQFQAGSQQIIAVSCY